MIVQKKNVSLCILLIALSVNALAQSSFTGGAHLEIKSSINFSKVWKLDARLGSRTLFFEGGPQQTTQTFINYERTELEMVLTGKSSSSLSLGGGYLIRNQNGNIKNRFIQQLAVANKYGDLKVGHRFRLDETFQKNKATLYRFRYRVGIEKSLSSIRNNTYLFFNNEYIPSVQKSDAQLEVRLLPGFGYQVDDWNKLEVGVDFRIEELFSRKHKQVYLFYVAWRPDIHSM